MTKAEVIRDLEQFRDKLMKDRKRLEELIAHNEAALTRVANMINEASQLPDILE